MEDCNATHLPRIDSPTSSVVNEERNALRASSSQRMVEVEEELWNSQVIGNERSRLRRDEFGHVFVI
jgi:hypothetical protein